MAKRLTAIGINAIKGSKSRQEIADAAMPGLYLIVQPSGAKSWAVRCRNAEGKVKKITIGSWPQMQISDAHNEAARIKRDRNEGKDPHAEAMGKNQGDEELFENIAAEFIKYHIEVHNAESTQYEHKRLLNKELVSRWTGKRMADINMREINRVLSAIVEAGHGTTANHVHSLISKIFRWAKQTGRLEVNIATDIAKPAPTNCRDRVLDHGEMRLAWLAAERMGYPFGPALQMLILTGQRLTETCRLEFRELNMDNFAGPIWTIPKEKAKNGQAHIVPLMASALDILKTAPRIGEPAKFAFTHSGDLPVRGYTKNKAKIDKLMLEIAREEAEAAGRDPKAVTLDPWGLHDLRRTLATRMEEDLDIPNEVVHAILNHRKRGLDKNYNHAKHERRKAEALNRWDAFIKEIVAGGRVVPLQKVA